MSREAALKAWATRRRKAGGAKVAGGGAKVYRPSPSGRHAPILPSGQRAMAGHWGGKKKPKPMGSTTALGIVKKNPALKAALSMFNKLQAQRRARLVGTLSPSMFPKVAGQVVNAMRQVKEFGESLAKKKRRVGGVAERAAAEWAGYANQMARVLAHTARRRRMV